jgi:PAS domain S-box-containing protein
MDISVRKRAEEALRQNNELLSKFIEHSPIYTFIKEVSPTRSTVLQASENFADMVGIPGSRMVGKTMEELFPAEFAAKITADDWAVCEKGEVLKLDEDLKGRNYTTIKFPIIQGNRRLMAGYTIDMTERREVERQLQRQTALFQNLFKSSPEAIAVLDHEDRVLEINLSFEALFGYSQTEARGQQINDLLAPEPYRGDAQGVSARVIQAGQVVEKEAVRCAKGGRPIDVFLIGYPIVIDQQKIGAYAIYRDITERRMAEQERESLHRTAEALAGVFLSLGPEPQQNMDQLVRAACELTGSSAALFNRLDDAGHSLEIWSGYGLPPDMPRTGDPRGHICYEATIKGQDRTIILGNLQDTDYARTDPVVGRYGLKAYLGHPVQLRGVAIGSLAVMDGKVRSFTPGEIGAVQMLAKALSLEAERHLVEQELKQSEERFRGMLQNVATVAVQGYAADGTVRYWNRASELFYGYTAEEAVGRSLLDLIIPPAMHGEAKAAVRRMAETGEPVPSSERALLRKDGSQISVYCSHALVRVPGRELEFFCIDVDLSARQQAEAEKDRLQEQLLQAQKMESVGRLAGGVAHDFNNMLSVILGHAELALLKIAPDDPLLVDLEEIRKAAERSADLTRQLLAFARKQTVSPRVLDLNGTVESALKMLRRLIGEDIDLVWVPGRNLERIFMDSSQVDQILTNLCVNARDAIAGTGRITIATENIVFDEEYCGHDAGFVPGEYVLLAVSDNGSGMDPGMLSHIFEPFFTTKEMGKGTGLGLAIVYGAVKQNNGFIDVHSEPGRGTTFTIYLPRHVAKAASRPKPGTAPAPVSGGETILLVEDEPSILKMTAGMLENMGYAVITAGTPGEAIRLAREHEGQIDLLVTDVVMPEMNGRDLARNLLSIYPDLKRLFMSGYTADVIAHHGVLDEGVHFIQKPFSMKDLGAKLRETLKD